MDGFDHLVKSDGVDVFCRGHHRVAQHAGIIDKAGHFGLCAAVAELEVVQHLIVAARQALVGCGDGLHAGAHFVGVVGHVCDGRVCQRGGGLGVAAQALQQAGRKAGDRLHVGVGGKPGCGKGVVGCGDDLACGVAKQRFYASDALFEGCALGDGFG